MARTQTPTLDLRGVHKSFPAGRAGRAGRGATVQAVRGIDLRIEPGEVVALLGPNGAGKTTTLDMILGFTAPTAGTVQLLGGDPTRAVTSGAVSSVMQTGGLLPRLTVGATLALVASLFDRTDDLRDVAARAGITGLLDRRVGRCSGGEQQRLRFALALLPDPELLLLDEPTTGLDVAGRRAFWEAIRADADRGRTIVFATHYLAEADDIADRIVLMRAGRIVADGTPAQVKAAALGRRVRARVGAHVDAEVGALPGVTDVARAGGTLTVRTTDSDALARHLLGATDATDVEITAEALEDAFVALTTDATEATKATEATDTTATAPTGARS